MNQIVTRPSLEDADYKEYAALEELLVARRASVQDKEEDEVQRENIFSH